MQKVASVINGKFTNANSPSLPGKRMTTAEFKEWIANAECSPSVSLEDAKSVWASKRKLLLRKIR